MGLWYDIKSKLLSFFSDIRIYPGGFILFGSSSYHINGKNMRSILNVIKPGDVLLRRYSHYLGSVLIPGHFSHAAIYVGDDNVIHMLGEGINKEDLLTFLRCDDILILRSDPDLAIQVDAIYAVARSNELFEKGISYDFNFDNNPERLYCAEFINYVYGNCIDNKKIINPDDFLDCDIFKTVWTT
jgi:uncharacterized protein YycO